MRIKLSVIIKLVILAVAEILLLIDFITNNTATIGYFISILIVWMILSAATVFIIINDFKKTSNEATI